MGTSVAEAPTGRDRYVDWLRSVSLLVVVGWHWAFTILIWREDGPHTTSPLGFTTGLWILTWLLQVMPLFFYIGGYVHLLSWRRAHVQGVGIWRFTWRRIRQIAVPAGALLVTWVVLGIAVGTAFDLGWMGRAVRLVVSPLWFVAVYLMLIALLPISLWLHRRFGLLVLVWLAGTAMVVDVLRFRYDVDAIGWLNMLIVWGLAHQVGFFHGDVVAAPRRVDACFAWGGLFGLVGLVFSGLYPGSMVGVPGERWSNMAPPTFVIVALLTFQVGVAELLRPAVERLLERSFWQRVTEVINRFALPLFLFHMTGMAVSLFLGWLLFDLQPQSRSPDLVWWLTRPLAVAGALVCTLPVIWLFGRGRATGSRQPSME